MGLRDLSIRHNREIPVPCYQCEMSNRNMATYFQVSNYSAAYKQTSLCFVIAINEFASLLIYQNSFPTE